jgi:hypothetical protein
LAILLGAKGCAPAQKGVEVEAGAYSEILQRQLWRNILQRYRLIELRRDGLYIYIARGDEDFQEVTVKASLALFSTLMTMMAHSQSAGTFTATGNMTTPRAWHTATLLPDGRVLIAGGVAASGGAGDLASAELFDPSTGTFSPTGDMNAARAEATATLLPNGKVLIAGSDGITTSGTADLYDPKAGTFAPTGNMIVDGAYYHTATLLPDGRVLFVAEEYSGAGAQVYDPSTGTFAPTASPYADPYGDSYATSLPDGRVLITQGNELRGELYDPRTNAFSITNWPREPWVQGPATLLLNGHVLLAGGFEEALDAQSALADVYDPVTQIFRQTGNMTAARTYHTATLLPDWTVLIAGGDSGDIPVTLNSTELYDPASQTFTRAANMVASRYLHTATLLNNGKVLIAGGYTNPSAELYTPASVVPAPVLFSLSGDGQGQGAIWHSTTGAIVSASNPAIAGEALSTYTTNLGKDGVVPPQVIVAGKIAQVLYFGPAPGYPGYYQVNFAEPEGVASGPAVPVRLTYIGRSSNEVSMSVQ